MVQLLIFSLAWIMFKVICGVKSFNIDTTHPIVYEDPRANVSRNADSYFGYSVQFLLSKSIVPATKWILIGAPKSNSSYPGHDTMNEPGQVYRCSLGDVRQDQCQRIVLENKGTHLLFKKKIQLILLGLGCLLQPKTRRRLVTNRFGIVSTTVGWEEPSPSIIQKKAA